MSLGEQLKKLRKTRGWTQAQLSKKTGIDKRNLSRYETDTVRPRRTMLEKLADVFEVDADELESISTNQLTIQDPELFEQFRMVEQLGEEDKKAIKCLINAVLVKNKVHKLTS